MTIPTIWKEMGDRQEKKRRAKYKQQNNTPLNDNLKGKSYTVYQIPRTNPTKENQHPQPR